MTAGKIGAPLSLSRWLTVIFTVGGRVVEPLGRSSGVELRLGDGSQGVILRYNAYLNADSSVKENK